jgi:predicted dehydrogenase
MNWRLSQSTSAGLVGEIGIHSLDTVSWFTKALPTAVSGFGHVAHWQDGRSVPDTVHCVLEFPGGLRCGYDATLANSFDSTYELLMGTDAAVMLRGERAWMFKEVDAPLQGWEVYARKEQVGDETGIALVADATKLLALGKIPGKDKSPDEGKDALYYAVEAFLDAVRGRKPTACGPTEAFQATVVALKTNEAVVGNTRINLERQWFELA